MSKEPSTPLEWALAYTAHGYSVLPAHRIDPDGLCSCGSTVCISPGKHPRLATWAQYQQTRATTQQVSQWWAKWPTANVAIVTGAISGIVVIDIDPRNGGNESKSEFDFPPTVTDLTGGGGEHYYYAHPGGIVSRPKTLAPGIDLKGDGGYVIAPPSNHELNRAANAYRWEASTEWDDPLTPFPSFINQLDPVVEAKARPDFKSEIEYALQAGIPAGKRNIFLTQLAGHYFAQGLSYQDTFDKVWSLNSQASLPDGKGSIPDLHEVTALVKSIYHRDQVQREQRAILAALDSSEIGLLLPEQKQEYAATAWGELGVTMFRWIKNIDSDSVQYVLDTADRTCLLGDDLYNQPLVRKLIINHLDVAIPAMKKPDWERKFSQLAHLAVEAYTGALTTEAKVGSWMDEYLIRLRQVEEGLEVEALKSGPILLDGMVYLPIRHLMKWYEFQTGAKNTTVKQIGNDLRSAGWENSRHYFGEQRVRVWSKSQEIV